MSNYTKATDFATKDGLLTGNPAKIIKGTEIDDEFNAIAVAVSTKADLASPTFTGTPAAPTASPGTNTTQIATTAFVGAEVTAATGSLGTMSTQDANNVSITGGSITDINDLAVADGGTGASSFTANNVLLGNGTSSFQTVAPGTSGNVLTSNGTTWESTIPSISTSSFTGANQSLASSGYQKFPGGLIIQWGVTGSISPNSTGTITFPTAFTNACYQVVTTHAGGANSLQTLNVSSVSTTTFSYGAYGSGVFRWIAVGS